MSLKLKIIIGSTRPGRIGPKVADWVAAAAGENGAFDVDVVDLAEVGLPLLDETKHPAMQAYEHDHTKRWSAIVDEADAFVFVTPEYDAFPPAALVNALQALVVEWNYKPAAIVSYGGVSGGMRSGDVLRSLVGGLKMMALPGFVPVPFVWNHFDDNGDLVPNDPMKDGAAQTLAELAKWATALKPMRSADAQEAAAA